MALVRLRDIGDATFFGDESGSMGCPRSATITLDSEILRAKCGAAISERYQGITSLSIEISIETLDPFADIHPGDFATFGITIPGAVDGSGLPGIGIGITVAGVVTGTVRRFVRNDLSNGTYTLRGISADGITCPITFLDGVPAIDSGAGPSDFIRDIVSFDFDDGKITADDFCPESIEMTEAAELIEDSCQGQLWPTYVGVTGLNVTVTATGKGVKHGFDGGSSAFTCLGRKGRIEVEVAVGSDVDCASLTPSSDIAIVARANVTSMTITATSGEISTISLTWVGHGEAGEFTDESKRAYVFV